ncbi:MAG: TolC family protein, partial [Cyanobacteria bacterium P01_D01_bin.1]
MSLLPKTAVAAPEDTSTDTDLQIDSQVDAESLEPSLWPKLSASAPLPGLSSDQQPVFSASMVTDPELDQLAQTLALSSEASNSESTTTDGLSRKGKLSPGFLQLRDRLFGEFAQPLPAEIISNRQKAAEPVLLAQSDDGNLPALGSPTDTAPTDATPTDATPADDTTVTPAVTPSDAPAAPPTSSSDEASESETPLEILESETTAPVNASELEIEAVPDSLLADPNPLTFPTTTEEVTIEQNPTITLEQAIELAYRNNQSLQTAILTREQATAAVREARAALRPNVDIGSNLITQESTRPTNVPGLGPVGEPSGADTTLSGSVEVNYNLLTGGSRRASIRAAELQEQISTLAVEVQQEQIRLNTANAYYDLQDAGEQIRINQSFLEEAERNLRDSRLRQEVGVGTRFDTLRAEVQFANARQSLIQSQSQERVNRRAISQVLNLPPTASITATPVTVAKNWPLDLEESIVLAFQNRAELEQQLYQADLNEEQRKIALAA